jgi:hypothetical protein
MSRLKAHVALWMTIPVFLCFTAETAAAREAPRERVYLVDGSQTPSGDLQVSARFGVALAGTTWIGWKAGEYDPVTNPNSIGAPGVWDFDDGGTRDCPIEDDFSEYIKNGAYAQGWVSEDVYAQKGLYWHAEDFSDPGFACQGNSALSGSYSAWCGLVESDPSLCFTNAPGYGHGWSQWLCRTVANPTGLAYTFKSDTEPGYDYAYVIVDAEFPDSCGWVGEGADTIRCYDGAHGLTQETVNLTSLSTDPDLCDVMTTSDYSGDTVKICFVVVSDGAWDDEDGEYDTCDGAFTVDDVILDTTAGSDTTTFETGTLESWTKCGGFSAGDYAAVRDRGCFLNDDVCGFDNCDMAGCVLAFFNPNIPGAYGLGGHYAGDFHKRAWSPAIDLTGYSPRGYVLRYTSYTLLPVSEWIFPRIYVRYAQDPDCPTGAWSPPYTDGYCCPWNWPYCGDQIWPFTNNYVPADADSVQIGFSVWNACNVWDTPCTNGRENPIYDNIKLGVYDVSAPMAHIRSVDNYTDAFPEDDELGGLPSTKTALIDIAGNLSQTGYFLRLGDTATVALAGADVMAELCFRIVPGPGTDTSDPWFAKYGEGGLAACDTTDIHCTRMDTSFKAGNGIPGSDFEFQRAFPGYYSTMIHEEDPLYVGEGEEILPDSLFTPGTKIFYAIRTSYLPGPGPYNWLPAGPHPGDGVSDWYEVTVLPDQCKDPSACLLYVDYYNRGAQEPIEAALTALGRSWDRFDLRAESSHQGNGIGNRLLGAGRYRLARGPIGPSNDHLAQYKVILLNTGHFPAGTCISDGGTATPDDPTDDVGFLDQWINEGPAKGLWLSGDNIATDFSWATTGPKPGFLNTTLCASLISESYRDYVVHSPDKSETCRELNTGYGYAAGDNYWDTWDTVYLYGSACPPRYNFDVLGLGGGGGVCGYALQYDDTHLSHGPGGLAASVYHVFPAANAPNDTVRTLIDGFSVNNLRDGGNCANRHSGLDYWVSMALWMRDVLGGTRPDEPGYMYDRALSLQYCPPEGTDTVTGVDVPGRTHADALFQNYPNPFGGSSGTNIHYSVAKACRAEIRIFDAAGRLVDTIVNRSEPGHNSVVWNGRTEDGRRLSSGVYFYQVKTEGLTGLKKMLLID